MIEIIPNWHPIFVHFTVALLSIATVFFLLARFGVPERWRGQWRTVAYWNLWAGVAISVLTVIAGWDAFNTVKHDDPSHEAMIEHRNWAIVTFLYFGVVATWAWRIARADKPVPAAFLAAMVVGAGLVTSTAWHGGELVYRHGLGVMSLPKAEGAGHAHTHADGGHAVAPAGISSTAPDERGRDPAAAPPHTHDEPGEPEHVDAPGADHDH